MQQAPYLTLIAFVSGTNSIPASDQHGPTATTKHLADDLPAAFSLYSIHMKPGLT
jgi:hypothetical protein